MKLIVGLGNPGQKYRDNRHNIGFITLDEWAYQRKVSFDQMLFDGVIHEERIAGEKIIFLKPQIYMNASGEAIRPVMNYFHIDMQDLLVIYDDMDLPVGKIRLRQRGSAGGHNGIKSIITCLGTNEFNRVKIGVGRPRENQTVISHVLGSFAKEEHEEILSAIQEAVSAIDFWIESGDFSLTMNRFN